MNRISQAIVKMELRLAGHPTDKVALVDKNATLDFEEWTAFNNARAFAQASEIITYDESATLAAILGIHTPDTFKSASVAQRVVCMQACTELLGRVIAAKQSNRASALATA